MSLIAKCKFGDCSNCGAKDTDCVKLGKVLVCLKCNRELKVKAQIAKATVRNKVRSLGGKQVASGNYFQAEMQAIKNDLDYVVRRMIKLMVVDKSGWANCYICDTPVHIDNAQAMHFIKRGESGLRYDFRRNIRYGCKTCNEYKDGNLVYFEERLNQEYPGLPAQLKEESREVHKWSREELKQLLSDLRPRLRLLEEKFKTK